MEELLYPEERKNIKKISEQQKNILERREAIRIILYWKDIKKWWVVDKDRLNQVKAYSSFLKKEWFFKNEDIVVDKKSKNINKTNNIEEFSNICSEVYLYTKWVYSDLNNGLSNIKILNKITNWLNDLEKKLVVCSSCKNLDYSLKERYKSLISNLTKVIKLLNQSKEDIVDYYSNKTDIFNLLKLINNSLSNLLSSIEKKY